jgi:hypothetical protein
MTTTQLGEALPAKCARSTTESSRKKLRRRLELVMKTHMRETIMLCLTKASAGIMAIMAI